MVILYILYRLVEDREDMSCYLLCIILILLVPHLLLINTKMSRTFLYYTATKVPLSSA